MTAREQELIKAVLDIAHDADGHQYQEAALHGAVNCRLQERGRISATKGEFDAALAIIGERGWMTRVENRVTGRMKWNINDAGEAARLELA